MFAALITLPHTQSFGSAPHRYVWLLFKQPGVVNISASDLQAWTSDSFLGRRSVNVTLFADTYQTGPPVGINWHREFADGVRFECCVCWVS